MELPHILACTWHSLFSDNNLQFYIAFSISMLVALFLLFVHDCTPPQSISKERLMHKRPPRAASQQLFIAENAITATTRCTTAAKLFFWVGRTFTCLRAHIRYRYNWKPGIKYYLLICRNHILLNNKLNLRVHV